MADVILTQAALKTGRVSPGGGVGKSPRAVPPSVSALPCLVSGRDPTELLGTPLTYIRPEWVNEGLLAQSRAVRMIAAGQRRVHPSRCTQRGRSLKRGSARAASQAGSTLIERSP